MSKFGNNLLSDLHQDYNLDSAAELESLASDSAKAQAIARAAAAVPAGLRSTRAVAFVGQSNERGSARIWGGPGTVARHTSFCSQRGVADPIAPAVFGMGSMLPLLDDELGIRGHFVRWRNCAIGGSSFIKDWAGQISSWQANFGYNGQRGSIGAGDAGDYGDVIVDSGRIFRCTVGRARYATNTSGVAIPGGGGATDIDYVIRVGTQTSGATKPSALATAAVNDVIVDNTVSWTCISTSTTGYTAFNVLTSGQFGFDPLGLLARTKTALDAVTDVSERWVFMANGQSDAQADLVSQPTVRGWYRQAIESIVNYFLNQNYKIAVGLSCWNPSVSPAAVFNDLIYTDRFKTLQLAIADAFAGAFAGNANVVRGGDLYQAFGYNVLTYPEPPATAISLNNAPHMTAEQYIPAAKVWADALIASNQW